MALEGGNAFDIAAVAAAFGSCNVKKGKAEPDGSSGVDLCHHLLPPANPSIVSYFPQGVVFYNVADSEGGAGATFIEGLASWRGQDMDG